MPCGCRFWHEHGDGSSDLACEPCEKHTEIRDLPPRVRNAVFDGWPPTPVQVERAHFKALPVRR